MLRDNHITKSRKLTRILHYKILSTVGVGGMGVVYRAHDTRLDRVVALKFLPKEALENPEAQKRLVSEAKAAAKLDHPNVGTIYAIEETDEQLFIVMAYYQGRTLEERISEGPIPWQEAVGLTVQVAKGLNQAHDYGIVHRDIKPGNLIVTSHGLLKILDFGLAILKEKHDNDEAKRIDGTINYMPPEQLTGKRVDERADIWALGVVLYEMLSQKRPFEAGAEITRTMLNILKHEPEELCPQNPNLPERIDQIISRALTKELAERYQSCAELISDLLSLSQTPLQTPDVVQRTALGLPTVTADRLPEIANNIPASKSPLVSRQDELALINSYLQDDNCRLLTLLGLGGTGKTRLSLEVARLQLEQNLFQDGVYFVSLDALEDASYITTSIAEAMHLELSGNKEPLQQIIDAIAKQSVLLVLDNFEHMMAGVILPADLLQACPRLKVLVTSRERLNLEQEWLLPLQGLEIPEDFDLEASEAENFGAVQLFKQRARRVQPQFSLSNDNITDVLKVCRLVNGLPLGIELAAAWVRMMSVADIVAEIQQNYDFLESSSHDKIQRHRSIRAVFDYSWQLLSSTEQKVLRQLSVFRGGINSASLKAVTNASVTVLISLADKSLLQIGSGQRFSHHPVLLHYAAEKLAEEPQDSQDLYDRYGYYFLSLVVQQGKNLRGAEQKEALKSIDLELENIRSAWRWAYQQSQVQHLRHTAEPLRLFYDQRGLIQEGLVLFTAAIDGLSQSALGYQIGLGHLKVNRAYFYILLGHYEQAEKDCQEGLTLLRTLQDTSGLMTGLNALANVYNRLGQYDQASICLKEGLSLAQSQDDKELRASFLSNLGNLEQMSGNYSQAQRYFEESLGLARETSNPYQTVFTLNNLGNLALGAHQPNEAKVFLEEGLTLAKDLGMERLVAFFLANLGIAAHHLAEYDYAVTLCQEALDLARQSGERWFEAGILAQLAESAIAQANFIAARQYLNASLSIAWDIKDTPLLLHNLIHYGQLLAQQGEIDRALPLVKLALHHKATSQEDKEFASGLLGDWEVDVQTPSEQQSLADIVAQLLKGSGYSLSRTQP